MGGKDAVKGEGANTAGGRSRASRKNEEGQVGTALREAYRATVEEAVPDEMLDLLNKLR